MAKLGLGTIALKNNVTMANIRRIDLGAPPSSVVPVYQDVYAAGAVGRAAMSVGEGIRDLGRSLAHVNQRKQALLANINQRKQALAGDATEANFIEGKAKLEAQIKVYQAKNPTDYDGLRKLAADGQAKLLANVADFAKRQGLAPARFEAMLSRANAQLIGMTSDVNASIEVAQVKEADAQLENSALLLYNSGKDAEADYLINRMQTVTPSQKEGIKRAKRQEGLAVRVRAEINSAQTVEEVARARSALKAKDANGMYLYSPELPLNTRDSLILAADVRESALIVANQNAMIKEAERLAKESVKMANAYLLSQTTADAKNNFAMAAIMLEDRASFNKQLGSSVNDEVKEKLYNALSLMSSADREALVRRAEQQAVFIFAAQSAQYREVSGAIDKGTVTIAMINELEKAKKLNAEGAQALRDQIEQSFTALAASGDDLADSINLKLYHAVKKNLGFAGVEGFKGMDVDPISDYEELRIKILAKGNGMSEESKFRAMQNVAFLQMYDISDGDIDASWAWDETLQPEVREWMQAQLFDVVTKSDRTGMGATEIGNRLFNVIDTGKRLNRLEGDKLKKQIEVETKVLKEAGGIERAQAAFNIH